MRMKTKLINTTLFYKVAQCAEKLSKHCILKFDPNQICFFVPGDSVQGHTRLWSEIQTIALFYEFRIESQCDNMIGMEVAVDFLMRALRSTQQECEVFLKLAKKNDQPLLSFTINTENPGAPKYSVVQEVPVRLLGPNDVRSIREPALPHPDVPILLPEITTVRSLINQMKNLSNFVTISANMNGEMEFCVETDNVEVISYFKDLDNPEILDSQPENLPSTNRDTMKFTEARVDIRELSKFLHCYQVHPTNVVCCFKEGLMLFFYVYIGPNDENDRPIGVITYELAIKHV